MKMSTAGGLRHRSYCSHADETAQGHRVDRGSPTKYKYFGLDGDKKSTLLSSNIFIATDLQRKQTVFGQRVTNNAS